MRNILLISLIIMLLTGCSKLHPYYVSVQQGNIIDQETIAQLHLGLSKSEVKSILGTSLVGNGFDTNTWTYVYTNQTNGGKIEKRKLTLGFKKDKLVRIN